MLLTIISFLLVLTILVLIHELGHYLTAKWLGVKVEEFGFGFPPRAAWKKIGETVYSLNWLPIGGFVKLYGEDDAGGGSIKISNIKYQISNIKKEQQRAFFTRSVWQRFSIVVAGVVMNFLLAVVLLTYLVNAQGLPVPGSKVLIVAIAKNSPAQKVGLVSGDQVVSVNNISITSAQQLISYTKAHLGKQVTLTLLNINHKLQTVILTPRVHYPSNQGAMGVAVAENIITKRYPWYQTPYVGLKEALSESLGIFQGIGQLVSQLVVQRQVPQDLAGPVGIAQLTGQFVQLGFNPVLSLLALLSLNLAVLNILPIPALDGGRLFFIVIEGVTRRKVSPKVEGYAHAIGMAVLLVLIVLITIHDFARIASGQSLLPR